MTFHIDKFEQFGSYRWFVPDGFQMVSASTHNPTIDLKITTATYGLYQICVDVFNKDGSFAERCCRNILYQDCLSSVIKGNVWADHNDNKTKEPTDGSLANVVLVLYNSSGTPIDTTMSDVLGNYEFNKLAEGNYYIKSAILSDTRMILFSPDAEPTVEAVTDDVERLDYGCAVELYRVVGGGHTWPGSPFDVAIEDIVGPVTMSISANETMWAFFEEHPLGP